MSIAKIAATVGVVFGTYYVGAVAGMSVGLCTAKKSDDEIENAINKGKSASIGAMVGAVTGIVTGAVISYNCFFKED